MPKDETNENNETENQITDAMEQRFAKMEARLQKIASDHAKRETSKVERLISELSERLGSVTEERAAQPKPDDTSKIESSPQWAEMKKLVAQQQAMIENMRKETERERQGRRDVEAISQIRAAASKHGVRPGLMDALAAHLYESKQAKLKYGEDGRLVFHAEPGLEVDPEQGFAEFFKSDAGKEWLAPVEASGSGASRPRQGQSQQNAAPTAADFAAALLGTNS